MGNGLIPEAAIPRNAEYLTELYGGRPSVNGIETTLLPAVPFNVPTVVHPYPQLFNGMKYALLADATAISSVDKTTSPYWTATPLTLFDINAVVAAEFIANGTFTTIIAPWDLALGWTYNAGPGNISRIIADANPVIAYQDINTTIGYTYRVIYTITVNSDDPVVTPYAPKFRVRLGTTGAGQWRYESGTYTEYIKSAGTGGDIYLDGYYGNITVDNVSVKQVAILSPTSSGVWQYADFGEMWFLFNGANIVFNYPGLGTFIDKSTNLKAGTGCAHRGRLILGNIPYLFPTSMYASMMEYYNEGSVSFGSNFVWWSSVSGEDVLYPFFNSVLDDQAKLDLLIRGESDFLPMEWDGTILALKELGDGVMVYGSGGISYLYPSPDFKTYGARTLANFGIASRGSVSGDASGHVFMDANGGLWRIGADLAIQKLGYDNVLSGMVGESITMSYNPQKGDHYISDNDECYVLTPSGLGEVPSLITSCFISGGTFVGIRSNLTDNDFRLTTNVFDLGSRSVKSIYGIEIGSDVPTSLSARIGYRLKGSSSLLYSAWKVFNDVGFTLIQESGVEFVIEITATDHTAISIDYINVLYQSGEGLTLTGFLA